MKTVHIIWTTYETWLPQDQRGDWDILKELYSKNSGKYELLEKSKLFDNYKRHIKSTAVSLSKEEQEFIEKEILILSTNDRIAEGIKIIAVSCSETKVELLIENDYFEAKQKVSRFKSRLATLLSFDFDYSGKNTWSKGIWSANILDEKFKNEVKHYIENQKTRTSGST